MFVQSHLKDIIKILPRDFGLDRITAISNEIDRKYANKVIPDIGLCMGLFDIIDSSEGKVLYGDGCLYHKVEFTLVLFRPFVGEGMLGKIKSSSQHGIRISIDFFDDITIPPRLLPYPSAYDPSHNEYFWASSFSDVASNLLPDLLDTSQCPIETRLYIQKGDAVRFRIEEEHFNPVGPKEAPKTIQPPPGSEAVPLVESKPGVEGPPPYSLVASCDGPGLGVLAWWAAPAADAEDDDVMQE